MKIDLENIDVEKLEKVALILKTIGHPVRLGIIGLLTQDEELSVNEICERLDLTQSLISHHLSNMKLKGILQSRRDGKQIYYGLKLQEVVTVVKCMAECEI
ncbi:metalloregulator ArsR/SmtB family transcription factor [Fulvivirgaceae bacterium BMA10]|uniref:Metalloregulator ArsR/SmtB family transcription factor n=1 Tax=Splendidivirga corallicola TaxID=3051826 RepID=A0ABT8KSH3_9BACT|nr:metalloregulator ArsR/SmtB family transcription factor [Fulvivirgaceae bacterium BMA10]